MTVEFKATNIFIKQWKKMKLNNDDFAMLKEDILKQLDNITEKDYIKGTGGAIKMRFTIPHNNKGKSGGARVIYANIIKFNQVHLILCYPKSQQNNLTDKQIQYLKSYVKSLQEDI